MLPGLTDKDFTTLFTHTHTHTQKWKKKKTTMKKTEEKTKQTQYAYIIIMSLSTHMSELTEFGLHPSLQWLTCDWRQGVWWMFISRYPWTFSITEPEGNWCVETDIDCKSEYHTPKSWQTKLGLSLVYISYYLFARVPSQNTLMYCDVCSYIITSQSIFAFHHRPVIGF